MVHQKCKSLPTLLQKLKLEWFHAGTPDNLTRVLTRVRRVRTGVYRGCRVFRVCGERA